MPRCPDHRGERLGVLGGNRLLDEQEPERLERVAEPPGVGDVEPAVAVDGELDVGPDGAAGGVEEVGDPVEGRRRQVLGLLERPRDGAGASGIAQGLVGRPNQAGLAP